MTESSEFTPDQVDDFVGSMFGVMLDYHRGMSKLRKDALSDIEDIRRLCFLISQLYDISKVGGPLHIVLDDGNVDDKSIKFCLEGIEEHWSVIESPILMYMGTEIAELLLKITEEERIELYENNWK